MGATTSRRDLEVETPIGSDAGMKRILAGLVLVVALAGCQKHHTDAIVLEKEYLPIRASTPTPTPGPETSENQQPGGEADTLADAGEPGTEKEPQIREMAPDEIDVNGVVMKAAVRGTEHDPRALTHEQWIVRVRTSDRGLDLKVYADQAEYERMHIGDRVKIVYRVGKYTGTVWGVDFE